MVLCLKLFNGFRRKLVRLWEFCIESNGEFKTYFNEAYIAFYNIEHVDPLRDNGRKISKYTWTVGE
jgi:hypothetical protein